MYYVQNRERVLQLTKLTSFVFWNFLGRNCTAKLLQVVFVCVLVVRQYDNETLLLTNVQRSDMGAYLCIASNGIPPTVSKRFIVQVHCKYSPLFIHSNSVIKMHARNKLYRHRFRPHYKFNSNYTVLQFVAYIINCEV